MCNLKFIIESDSDGENYLPVNSCAVAGIVSIGGGHSQLEEFSSALNLPLISNKQYQSIHDTLSDKWLEVAKETMDQAAEKERCLALSDGRVSRNGIPIIDVIVDGCYSKRSYKTNYSALSGAGAIIGKRTGEVLFVGVRNKYCYTCDRAKKKNKTIQEHRCFKNYTGPSTGMESDIIVEGFKQSIENHNLIYGRLISDGDSSTYNKILLSRPYQDEGLTVEKIECRNHLLRNFCNKLQNLQTDTRYIIRHRKLVTKKTIMSMRSVIKKAIEKNKNDESPNVQNLFEDILLSHHHAFGNHMQCKSYFCNSHGQQENSQTDFFSGSLWQRICLLTQNIAAHARSLIHDVDSNIVERFHSIIAKYIGGKRVNFSLKQSYGTRCHAATASFNTHKSISRLYKNILTKSPRGKVKLLEERRIRKRHSNRKYVKRKTRNITFNKPDEDYGEQCKKPDVTDEVLEKLKENFVNSLKKTSEERAMIERQTILQRDSSEWMELRRSLLTASNFGRVIKRKLTTRCANLVKDILYKTNIDHVASIKHGLLNEKTAIMQLAKQTGIAIEPCGLFLDEDLPFLGATPDGIISDDTIVEVKCPISAYKLGLDEAIEKKKINFWLKDKGCSKLNKNHNWYYQVQGQLHISKRQKCLFAVWSSETEELKTELILKDDMFWHNKMKDKLEAFYMKCLLPEIVDPRSTRNLPIREPGIRDQNMETENENADTSVEVEPSIDVSPQNENMLHIQPTCSRYLNFSEL